MLRRHVESESHAGRRSDMRRCYLAVLLTLIALVSLPIPTIGQAGRPQGSTKKWVPPRTAWGHPNLEGIWNNVTATPLQRSNEFKDKALLTDDEAAAIAKRAAQREAESESRPTAQQTAGQRTGYASS